MMGSKAGTKIAEGTLAKVWGILYETKTVASALEYALLGESPKRLWWSQPLRA